MEKDNVELIDELIGLDKWKTKEQIKKEVSEALPNVKLNERKFRQDVEEHNRLYVEHLKDNFVAHSNKGYKLTNDYNEIKASIEDNRVRAIDQLQKYYHGMKALGENRNCKLHIEDGELVYIEEKSV